MQAVEERQNFVLAGGIERGERFIHEHELRCAEQGAADRNPLCLAARESCGLSRQQFTEAQDVNDLIEGDGVAGSGLAALPVNKVAEHVEVIEQPGLLEHVADFPRLRRAPDTGGLVGDNVTADCKATTLTAFEASDQAQQGRLARA